MCPTTPDPTFLLGRALVPSRALQLQTLPSCQCGLQHCHVFHGTGPRLPAGEGSVTATCPSALDLISQLGWAPVLLCVSWLRIPPPCWGGLRHRRVFYGSWHCLPAGKGSGAATRPTIPYGPWASSIKKGLAGLPMQLGSCVSMARARVPKAPDARAIMSM
jgi:hypothetical protein